jgi:hypothetical protein
MDVRVVFNCLDLRREKIFVVLEELKQNLTQE